MPVIPLPPDAPLAPAEDGADELAMPGMPAIPDMFPDDEALDDEALALVVAPASG
jgi:hypothetical protein